uniref:Uncharacterized protein n=1 Tax=Glossina brevipalpis TaxID=37001 RepID=A0A1A9WXX1_9MUSC
MGMFLCIIIYRNYDIFLDTTQPSDNCIIRPIPPGTGKRLYFKMLFFSPLPATIACLVDFAYLRHLKYLSRFSLLDLMAFVSLYLLTKYNVTLVLSKCCFVREVKHTLDQCIDTRPASLTHILTEKSTAMQRCVRVHM